MNAVITGASRGIGKAVAEIFATHGYDLYLCSKNETHLLATLEELKTKFPNITVDGKAFDLGKKQQTELFAKEQAQQTQKVEAEKAAATLMAQATVPVVSTSMKPITETTEIEIKDYSDEWVVKIMAAFMANFQVAMAKVRVKKKSALTIAQMAAALDAANVRVEGVDYVTLKK
jgi:NAD(P)-dependent dehydrogenase (short-subunit alcohol dehydrogenase family)